MQNDRNIFLNSSGLRLAVRVVFLFFVFGSLNFDYVESYDEPRRTGLRFCTDGRKKGHRLNSTVHGHRFSISPIDCVVQCVQEKCCRSTNYRISHENTKKNCELLHAVSSEEPENLQEDNDYNYNILLTPMKPFNCECSSCENNGTCDVSNKSCLCRPGFYGNRCQKDVDECSSNPCHPNSTCNNTVGSYTCTCNQGFTGNGINCTVKSCAALYSNGVTSDGVYTIDPDHQGAFNVSCDMTTDGGGWTVFQRRMDGSVDFYRNWTDYKNGFGNLSGEFWLGLDKLNRLTESGQNVLRVDLEDFGGETCFAKYDIFAIANETDLYKLTVGNYSGNASESLAAHHNGMKFSTNDKDNDNKNPGNCAKEARGAWWYNGCYDSNLNGFYYKGGGTNSDGVVWEYWKKTLVSLKKSEMKFQRRN